MATQRQTEIMLVDSKNAGFATNYQQGFWWAMHGKRESTGPLEDRYVIDNLTACVENGWFEEQYLAVLFKHIGFMLGMIHGGVISLETNTLLPDATTLVELHNTNFQRGYCAGREYYFLDADPDEWRRTDRSIIHYFQDTVMDLSQSSDLEEVWHYCIGCLIGELSGQVFPCTPEEIHGWEQEHLELLGYEQHIIIVDRPFLHQVKEK
ncbi:MAG: hypothetical protein ACYDER_11055 [Ktedonobacteraceae bacterium]